MSEIKQALIAKAEASGFLSVQDIEAVFAALSSAAVAEREPVAQFRKVGCSDWYDGLPDHQDGRGPYEERTLYLDPPPTSELEAEIARLEARLAEALKALKEAREVVDACAGDNRPARAWAVTVRDGIDAVLAARRVREGGQADG